jgi:phosphoribosylanthranilate isomerase
MLRLPVKINGVNNLSDARYGAGMGVEMMGFCVTDHYLRHIPADKINGITGWIAGVEIVAECYVEDRVEEVMDKVSSIQASRVELGFAQYQSLRYQLTTASLVRCNLSEASQLGILKEGDVLHLKLSKNDLASLSQIAALCAQYITLLDIDVFRIAELEQLLEAANPHGISLDGGNELSPGLIDFERLAEVLEFLEV